ncbi:hypothetical protein KIPB_008559, partial [Kipferlia bialata]|eukprot:g8559.t1
MGANDNKGTIKKRARRGKRNHKSAARKAYAKMQRQSILTFEHEGV